LELLTGSAIELLLLPLSVGLVCVGVGVGVGVVKLVVTVVLVVGGVPVVAIAPALPEVAPGV
jgi:hypothetical protein